MSRLLSKENAMNEPAPIECKDAFLSRRGLLWQLGAELAVQLEGRLIAKHHDWSAEDCRSVGQQLSYGLMVGQLTERTVDQLLAISHRSRGKKVRFADFPCMADWQKDSQKKSSQWGDPEATLEQLVACRTAAWTSLSGLLEQHLAAINKILEREVKASLKGGATANDVTSIVWEQIQKRLLDGRFELQTHPEFRSYCRNCAKDVIRKLAPRVPDRTIPITPEDDVELPLPAPGKTPSQYMSVKELANWIDKMCAVLNPMDAYLLRKKTMDGLSFTELAEDPCLNSEGSRSPDALRKHFDRMAARLRERFGSEAAKVL